VNLKVKVANRLGERQVTSRVDGSPHRVAELLVGDETGCILLTLWDDLIEKVMADDIISIENGYVSLYRGSMRLNIGRFGKMEKIEGGVSSINSDNNLSDRVIEESERRFRGRGRFERGRF